MKKFLLLGALFVSLASVTACGQKGPLYLPSTSGAQPMPTHAPAVEEGQDHGE